MGLKEGTPVAEGGVDAFVAALGLGVVEPGKLALITGSSHVMIGQAAEPHYGQGFFGIVHGRHGPRPVHRGGRPGLHRLDRGLVQEPVRQ
jgi:ribulose kinase